MDLYIAALFTNNYREGQARYEKLTPVERNIFDNVPNILESYHYVKNQRFVDTMRSQNAKVFLDSGAFSAHSLGVSVDIDAYCDYVIKNRDILRVEDGVVMASVLDGIGNALQTYQNQLYMMKKGAVPLPCFHFGEPIEYLRWYVANFSYITIGGLVGKSKPDQQKWLDEIWEKELLDGSGRAKIKVHGFGFTSPELMQRYEWFSCDSSSWIQSAAFGNIYTSEFGPISVSKDSPSKHIDGRHITTLTDFERESIERMLVRKGFERERLSTVYESRAAYSCMGYCELNQLINQRALENPVYACTKMQGLF